MKTKKEFIEKMLGYADEINKTDNGFAITTIISDIEKLYDEQFNTEKPQQQKDKELLDEFIAYVYKAGISEIWEIDANDAINKFIDNKKQKGNYE